MRPMETIHLLVGVMMSHALRLVCQGKTMWNKICSVCISVKNHLQPTLACRTLAKAIDKRNGLQEVGLRTPQHRCSRQAIRLARIVKAIRHLRMIQYSPILAYKMWHRRFHLALVQCIHKRSRAHHLLSVVHHHRHCLKAG